MRGFLVGLLVGGMVGLRGGVMGRRNGVGLEEYKIFIEDTSRYSDRRQTVSNIYVAVNTAVLGFAVALAGTGYAETQGSLEWWRLPGVLALSIAGVTASSVWWALVRRYEQIIGRRVAELREIEKGLAGSHKMYRKMDEAFCGQVPSFSSLERVLPIVFIVLDSLLFCLVLGVSLWGLAAACGPR